MRRLTPLALTAGLLALGLLAGACNDDGSGVRNLDGSEDASGSGSEGGSGSTVDAECDPVGAELEADETVDVSLRDYAFDPDALVVDAGVVRFAATNDGGEPHELAVLPGADNAAFTEDGAPDEEALTEAGAFELEAFGPGQSCEAAWELDPGEYTLFCIVESADGETHLEKGMKGTLTVN